MIFVATGILLLLVLGYIHYKCGRKNIGRLPPGPPRWPIVGNLLQLGERPHESLFHLAQKYGPLMTLQLGRKTTVVVSSPSVARDVLRNNDHNFSSRSITMAARKFAYQGTTLVWSPYGSRWRLLRRICNTEIFSARRLDALQHLRKEEVSRTIKYIFEEYNKRKAVNIGATAFLTSLSLVSNMVCSKTVFQTGSEEAVEFKEMVWEVLKLAGTPNLSDFFPFFQRFDLQGLNYKMTTLAQRFNHLFDNIIQERLSTKECIHKNGEYEGKDFLEVLLGLRNEGTQFTLQDIKGLLMDMFVAGTDTTSATVEWAMAELFRKPELMKKVQAELDEVIGNNRMMNESHVSNLPYLQAVVKEVLRLHPAAPLIIPRRSDNSCEIAGFVVPENAQVFVNVWGIGRDPAVWQEPLDFIPERFLECSVDYRGQDFELIPFGAGRRICIGLPLAHRMVHLVIGSLLHSFNWSSVPGRGEHGMSEEGDGIDMSEAFGITIQKAVPLIAFPEPRLPKSLYRC